MTNITESTGPPSGPLPRKGDWQTRIRNMRTMRSAGPRSVRPLRAKFFNENDLDIPAFLRRTAS